MKNFLLKLNLKRALCKTVELTRSSLNLFCYGYGHDSAVLSLNTVSHFIASSLIPQALSFFRTPMKNSQSFSKQTIPHGVYAYHISINFELEIRVNLVALESTSVF